MADAVWVGVDLGTQSVRTVAVAATGVVLSAAVRALTSKRDGNRHEQDPHEWWTQVADALADMVRGLPDDAAAWIRQAWRWTARRAPCCSPIPTARPAHPG